MQYLPQIRPITVEGLRFVCAMGGSPSNPPLLLLPGWMSTPGVWDSTIGALRATHYCVAIGLLGSGESDKPPRGDYRIATQGRHVLAIADVLGIDTFSLMGHSRGGQIALSIAARQAPERVERLILVTPVVNGRLAPYAERFMFPFVALGRRLPWLYSIARWLVPRFPAYSHLMYGPQVYDSRTLPLRQMRSEQLSALQRASMRPNYLTMRTMRATDLTLDLHRVKAATTVIAGTHDGVVPPEQSRLAAARIPGAQLVTLERCGHYPMWEQPETYLEAVCAALGCA
ncbi:MAG: alpha/beta fold hydrolase [Chloroflexi bacterium]|nr:alpha/beta fold hydrolase [Chloroflexota bacterium]